VTARTRAEFSDDLRAIANMIFFDDFTEEQVARLMVMVEQWLESVRPEREPALPEVHS
jgi:hypothetical protein